MKIVLNNLRWVLYDNDEKGRELRALTKDEAEWWWDAVMNWESGVDAILDKIYELGEKSGVAKNIKDEENLDVRYDLEFIEDKGLSFKDQIAIAEEKATVGIGWWF